ncbi:Swi5-domain-containing protein [Sordaria brevicollis]|uniref:Swi5-domain-containing protein n=1 Tax=Sordaria brevicollis TaxID=83679 RepID=A0AAE0PP49_SORBR|nr:Swi5-domain-containing protein [Sordaria brevicollis]
MSGRPQPRKGRSRNNHSYNNGGSRDSGHRYAQQSDYDSDAINNSYAVQPSEDNVPEEDETVTYAPTTRTNYELNMSVLKRYYVKDLRSIPLTCSFVRLYEWSSATNSWELRDTEGPMFLCECEPKISRSGLELPQSTLFVLNRRSMINFKIDLSKVEMYEATNEKFLSVKMESDTNEPGKAYGFHLHSSEEKEGGDSQSQFSMDSPDWGLIESHWQKARAGRLEASYEQTVLSSVAAPVVANNEQAAPAPWASLGAFGEQINSAIMAPTKTSQPSMPSSPSSTIPLPEILFEAAQTQLDLISSFRLWLNKHKPVGFSSNVHNQLESILDQYKNRMDDLKSRFREPTQLKRESQDQEDAIPTDSWKLQVYQKQETSGKPALLITIGSHSPVEVEFENRDELHSAMGNNYLGYITKVFQAFEQAENDLIQLLMMSREIEEERDALSQPPEETVQQHIDLLKEYNDMKDIGQQLIGLIAENKGLSIGALYEDGQYGVTADD